MPKNEVVAHAVADLIQKNSLENLHRLFMALWTWKWGGEKFSDPTMCMVGLLHLQKGGNFSEPKHVTGTLASLTHLMRLAFVTEYYNLIDVQNMDPSIAMDRIRPFIRNDRPTTFGDVRSLQQYTSSLVVRQMSEPKIIFPGQLKGDFSYLLYEGVKITLPQISATLEDIEKRIVELMEKKVLLGSGLHVDWKGVRDNLTDSTVSYSFLDDPKLSAEGKRLLTFAFTDPEMRKRFVMSTPEGERVNTHAARMWLADLAELELLCMLAVEMKSGAPIRMTELTSTLVKNSKTRHRNLMIVDDHVTIIRGYSKGSNLQDMDKFIPHGLSGFEADVLIQIHTYVRPLAQVRLIKWLDMTPTDMISVLCQ